MEKKGPYKLVAWDFETTGNDPATVGVVQLGAVVVDHHGFDKEDGQEIYDVEVMADILLNPGMPIAPQAAEVHGITAEMVANEQRDVDVLNEFLDALEADERPIILATHNGTGFDVPIMERITGRSLAEYPQIDTLTLANRVIDYSETTDRKLSTLITELGLGSAEGAHDALADVKMVATLVNYFAERKSKETGKTWGWEELAEWCKEPMVVDRLWFGKYAGERFEDVMKMNKGYFGFLCRKFTPPIHPDLVVSVRHWCGMEFNCMKEGV